MNRPLENGTKLTLADPRRKIQVETVTDIRPARTARKKLGKPVGREKILRLGRGGRSPLKKGFSLPSPNPLSPSPKTFVMGAGEASEPC